MTLSLHPGFYSTLLTTVTAMLGNVCYSMSLVAHATLQTMHTSARRLVL